MIAFVIFAATALAAPSPVAVERLDESSFLLSVAAAPATNAIQAQAQVRPAARQACRKARAVLGRFRFLTEAGASRFEQELLCVDERHRLSIADKPAAGATLAPTRADQQTVLAASYDYFAAKDMSRFGAAYGMLSKRLQERSTLGEWTRSARDFNAEAGPVRGRRVVEITWYRDPEGAPEPGLYAAADFSADFARTEFVCGYLMWKVQPDGRLRLSREEQNMAPKRSSGRPIAEIDRNPLRARMGCKD